MTRARVCMGDITMYSADALIAPINSGGRWGGAIDGAIKRSSGPLFHRQAQAAMPLSDGQVIYATPNDSYPHNGLFRSVIFVVDDVRQPLQNIVLYSLNKAEDLQLRRVVMPAMRTGVALGYFEVSLKQTLDEIALGITTFVRREPVYVEEVTVVVFDDMEIIDYLKSWPVFT